MKAMRNYSNGPGNVPRLPNRVVDTLIDAAGVSRLAYDDKDQTAQVDRLVHDVCEELLARLPASAPISATPKPLCALTHIEALAALEAVGFGNSSNVRLGRSITYPHISQIVATILTQFVATYSGILEIDAITLGRRPAPG